MQATGSYLKRQSALAITGTATADEDDENKLRRKASAEAQTKGDEEREAILQQGRDAAMKGTPALNAWWGKLTAKQRNDMQTDFASMRRAAAVADKGGQQ
jgi:hypothetical protein